MSDSRPIVMPELPATCGAAVRLHRIVRGHLSATLYNGDCLEILPQLDAVDAVISDPPYGISIVNKDGTMGGTSRDMKRWAGQINPVYDQIEGDDKPIDPRPLLALGKVRVLWGGNYIADQLPPSKAWLVWYKRVNRQSNDYADCELAWTDASCPARVFQHLWMGMLRDSEQGEHHHPTQKPVALMGWAMEQVKVPVGATVLDPYMGSGTTGIACLRTGRNFIGIEKSPKHFATAVARLEREANQGALL